MKRVLIAGICAASIGASLIALPKAFLPPVSAASQPALPSTMETAAMEAAVTASAALAGISPVAATELGTVLHEHDVVPAADFVARHGALPDVAVSVSEDGTITSTPFRHGTYADRAAEISGAAFKEHRDALPIELGCTLVQLDWTSADAGPFSTVSIVHPVKGVLYDSLLSNFVASWPLPSSADDGTGAPFATTLPRALPAGAPFPGESSGYGKNLYQITVFRYSIEVRILCDGAIVTYCSSKEKAKAVPLYDIAIGTQSTTVGNCCIIDVQIGVTSGFRSVTATLGGTQIEFSGALGFKLHDKFALSKCCLDIEGGGDETQDPEDRNR